MNKFKKCVLDILVVIVLVISNILVGGPLKYNLKIFNILIGIVFAIFCVVFIKKKQKIKITKLDILILLLSLTTLIPLISKKYIKLEDTIQYVFRYLTAFGVYFVVKQYIKMDEKKLDVIVNIIVIMSFLLVLFGIDLMAGNFLQGFYDFCNIPKMMSESKERMTSLFKYANTFCVYCGLSFFVTVGGYLKEKEENKLKKSLYSVAIFAQMIGILMSFSRFGWILILGLFIFYFIYAKDNRGKIVELVFFSVINVFVYFAVINKQLNGGTNYLIWLAFLVQSLIQFTLFIYLNFENNLLKRVNKKIAIVVCVLIVSTIGAIMYIISPNELVLFNSNTNKKSYKRQNIIVDDSLDIYNFEIDMKTEGTRKDHYKVLIRGLDDLENVTFEEEFKIGNFDGVKSYDVVVMQGTSSMELLFKCSKYDEDTKMTIRSVKVNGNELKVYYKLIPISLVNRLEKIKLSTSSEITRRIYYQHAIEIIKTNPIFGFGGNAWKYMDMGDIEYISLAEHNYLLQLFIQNGIGAFIVYIIIMICVAIRGVEILTNKKRDIMEISFLLSLLLIIFHSFLDFDMHFEIILIYMYIFLGILDKDNGK